MSASQSVVQTSCRTFSALPRVAYTIIWFLWLWTLHLGYLRISNLSMDCSSSWQGRQEDWDSMWNTWCLELLLFRELAFTFCLSLDPQVILMLTTDLDGEDEKDKGALDNLLSQLIAELGMDKKVTFESHCLRSSNWDQFFFFLSQRNFTKSQGVTLHWGPQFADPLEMFSVCTLAQAYFCGSGYKWGARPGHGPCGPFVAPRGENDK